MDLRMPLSRVLHRPELAALLFALPAAAQVAGPPLPIPPGQGVAAKQGFGARLFVVDDTPGCRFSGNLQEAIDAASDGDIVLVRPGIFFGGISIDGKAVSLFGDPEGVPGSVRVSGSISIKNLRADQTVALRDLNMVVTTTLSRNEGHLWIERCTLNRFTTIDPVSVVAGSTGFFDSECSLGISALNGAALFAYHSRFYGVEGRDDLSCSGYCLVYPYDYEAYCTGGTTSGGSGVNLAGLARAYLFGCEARGGSGGLGVSIGSCCDAPDCFAPCESAGNGVSFSAGTELTYMDLVASGGPQGCPAGTPLAGSGSTTVLTGEVGSYSITGTLLSGASAQLTFRGPAGWNVFLTYSDEYAPVYLPDFKGYSVVDSQAPTIFIGQLPLSGELSTSVPFSLPHNELAKVLYSQAKLYDPTTGTPYLASASAMLVLREPCP